MPSGKHEFSVQGVLNRVFVPASNRLVTGRDSATGHGAVADFQAQEIWNRAFEVLTGFDRLRLDG